MERGVKIFLSHVPYWLLFFCFHSISPPPRSPSTTYNTTFTTTSSPSFSFWFRYSPLEKCNLSLLLEFGGGKWTIFYVPISLVPFRLGRGGIKWECSNFEGIPKLETMEWCKTSSGYPPLSHSGSFQDIYAIQILITLTGKVWWYEVN